MRYERDQKEKTRRRIVDAASKRFREDGIASSGIAAVMADAGLTNGAFYAHFASKEHLVREVLSNVPKSRTLRDDAGGSRAAFEAWIRGYLSASHRDNPGTGCAVAALVGEVGRHRKSTRSPFTDNLNDSIEIISRHLGESVDARLERATAIYALAIGTLQLARAASDEATSNRILESGVNSALALSGLPFVG